MRLSGRTFDDISKGLRVDGRKANALVSGRNLRTHLVQLYLNSQMLPKPRIGWKWVLESMPKPTKMYPKVVEVPDRIRTYQDILDFLKQFPPVPEDYPAIRYFGLSSEWVEQHKAELFGFLLGFILGDAGKNYAEYEYRSRHYRKTAMNTNMSGIRSNMRILYYVQMRLHIIGIHSHRITSINGVIRWNSQASDLLTWTLRVCLGLEEGQRTSRNPVTMSWILGCPKHFIISFLQGLAESDGHVDKYGYYVDIASKPNSIAIDQLLKLVSIRLHVHPKHAPRFVKMSLTEALKVPLFNPIIRSYRYELLISHSK